MSVGPPCSSQCLMWCNAAKLSDAREYVDLGRAGVPTSGVVFPFGWVILGEVAFDDAWVSAMPPFRVGFLDDFRDDC